MSRRSRAVPGSEEAIRRAWLLLRDPFASPPKGIRILLLLGWLAWFPPRQWGEGAFLWIAPACMAAVAVAFVVGSARARRRAARDPEGVLREELDRSLRKFEGMEQVFLVLAVLLLGVFSILFWKAGHLSRPLTTRDAASLSVGALILWGTVETVLHHRRAARYAGK